MQKLFLLQLYPAKERASNAFWCSETESNCRHGDFQSPALPTELSEQELGRTPYKVFGLILMATQKGLEPSTSSVTGWHSNQAELLRRTIGGNYRARTCDPLLVRQMLSQLS